MGRISNLTPPASLRVVVLGDKDVGKSALVVRFLTKRFIGEYVSGTEFNYQKEVSLAGSKITAEICDAVIKQDQQNYIQKLSGNIEACLLVYNVCNRQSFEYACQLARDVKACELKSPTGDSVPLLLVGNKSDLDHFRKVKETEGEEFARSLSMCHFVETSAAESYTQVEHAFKIVFQLVQASSRSSLPPPTNGLGRIGRKNSWSQMAHLIRDHYKKQHAPNQNHINPIERRIPSTYDPAQNDKNNNSTKLNPTQRRMRKNSTLGFSHTPFPLGGNPKMKSRARCLSLTTLNEDQSDQSTPHLNKSNTCQDFNESLPKNSESSESTKSSTGDDSESADAITKMSLGSDDTLDLSDFSTPDEDAFLPETFNHKTKNGAKNKTSSDKSQESVAPLRKTSINKKNLKICIHSDDDFEEKAFGDFNEVPPVSAPIIRSSSSNRFRFFPNGMNENQDLSKALADASKSLVPSPLLSAIETQAMKSPKDEKRSPSYNFIKQFFKGARHSSLSNRSFGSNQTLSSRSSSRSIEHVSCSPTETKNIIPLACDKHQDLKPTPDLQKAIFVRTSSSSLSSLFSNDEAELESLGSPGSIPSSPKVNKPSLPVKVRRSSIRDAVGILIRKRKQSITNDMIKHSKERFY